MGSKKMGKEAQERSDMVIYSILLFISRLIPAFQLSDSTNVKSDKEDLLAGMKTEEDIKIQ